MLLRADHLRPDPDFKEFALDCIRLSNIARRYIERVPNRWTQTQVSPGPRWISVT
jgi:hypothetical protein